VSEEWDKPSEALRRMAEAPEPKIKSMTTAERDLVVHQGAKAAHVAAGHTIAYEQCEVCAK
jgi:hypothetical protein